MPTIKDIAAAAGVSVGTVSNVINKQANVSDEKRLKVEGAIQRLGFVPNSLARALKTNISRTAGLILPDITNPFYAELARGVGDCLSECGYTLFLCNKDRSSEKELADITALKEKNVDGIILVKPSVEAQQVATLARNRHLVLIDADMPADECYSIVNVDDEGGAYKMTQYLYRLGHRKIAYLVGNTGARSDRLRRQGYERLMKEQNIYDPGLLVECGHYSISAGVRGGEALLSGGVKPTAVFASNDILSIGVMQACYSRGLRVPEDLSIVGCDDISFSSFVHPALTTIRRPKYEMGYKAAELLLQALQGGDAAVGTPVTVLDSELVIRQSAAGV